MKNNKILWGPALIILGVLVLINEFKIIDINIILLLLTVILLPITFKSIFTRDYTGIFFPLAGLFIAYNWQYKFVNIQIWTVILCALLFTLGFSLLFGKRPDNTMNGNQYGTPYQNGTTEFVDDECVSYCVRFGSGNKHINSDSFRQANISAAFSGVKIYFDNSKMHPNGATIELDASFSGIELYVPKSWRIVDSVACVAGAVSEKNTNNGYSEQVLSLTGNIHFSGVEIIYT